jgi:protein arginine N-methyltransferase 2
MPSPIDDSLQARISPECPQETRDILYHAWGHDRSGLKKLLNERGKASIQDPKTGETPLHAAIRACGPADEPIEGEEEDEGEDGSVEEATEVIRDLFLNGAIWNDVDANNETPGCVAYRLGRKALYNLCVDAGVRAELLFALMDGYEELSSGEEEEDEDADEAMKDQEEEAAAAEEAKPQDAEEPLKFIPPDVNEIPVTSEEYLKSELTYDDDKLLDSDLNGVMMAWETDIMRRSVAALIPEAAQQQGKRVLNIGFGMGIIDGMFADLKPSKHHIIEAHPAVLEHIAKPDSKFGSEWGKSGPEEGAYKVFAGKWQDVVLQLLEQGELYDAIYFDTFGEDYSQLRMFLMEHVPGLLDQEGRFSFFNGLGADRRICYDVYTRVVEMHCADAGLDVEWDEIDVDMEKLDEDGEGEWKGVRRRYWTLDSKNPTPGDDGIYTRELANTEQSIDCLCALLWVNLNKITSRLQSDAFRYNALSRFNNKIFLS